MSVSPSVLLVRQPPLRAAAILASTAEIGLAPPTHGELAEARVLAARLMGHEVASLETFLAAMAVQPTAVLVFKEEGRVTGVVAQILVNRRAVDQIVAGRLDALNLDPALLTMEGRRPVASYYWGVAASTKAAGRATLAGGDAVTAPFPTLTAFCRAVTGAGRHVAITRYGYRPLRGPDDELMVRERQIVESAERAA
jgi:hypothetical protein